MKQVVLRISVVLLLAGIAHAQEKSARESVKPGINKAFLDPKLDPQEWLERFEVESREIFRSRETIVAAMRLKPADRIADIGSGTGLFIEPLSKAVTETGWVYAVDIAPAFVQRALQIAEEKQLGNVTPVVCGEADVNLAPESIDVAFLCDVYHHFEYPADSTKSIHRALRPGGVLYVIDFERIEGESREWILGHVRAGKQTFRSEIESAGFEFDKELKIDGFRENYFLRFRRK